MNNIFNDSYPAYLIHSRPYNGRLGVENLTLDTSKVSSGIYRNRINYYDDTDNNIFSALTYYNNNII